MKNSEFNPVIFEEVYEQMLEQYAEQPCPTRPRPKTSAQKAADRAGQVQNKAPKPPAPVNRTPNKPKPKKRKCPTLGAMQFDELNELKDRIKKTDGSYDAIDKEMKALAKKRGMSVKELHNKFKAQEGMIPDEWVNNFAEVYDFMRCQRSDGTFYGTGGVCRSGVEVGPREMKALKEKAAAGDKRAEAALAVVEGKKTPEAAKQELSQAAPKQAEVRTKEIVKKDIQATRDEFNATFDARKQAMNDGDFKKANELKAKMLDIDAKERALKTELATAPDRAGPLKKGELAPDKDAWKSRDGLEAAASSWRQRMGLTDETHEHDLVHAGTHSFLGRTSEDLARIQGTKGVTPSEEILVNLVSSHAMGGGGPIASRSALLQEAKDMKEFFASDPGVTPAMLDRWDRSASTAVKIFERMSKQDGFDDFISVMERYSA